MKSPVLVVDIGNTSTSLGLYTGRRVTHIRRVEEPPASARALRRLMGEGAVVSALRGAAVACVMPSVRTRWERALRQVVRRPVCWIDHEMELGLPISYPAPHTIGADRLANACAAVARYGAPVVVADFGTALTFDVISESKGYIGGVIAPGLPLMFSYLAEKTELLPRIELGPVRHRVGKSTEEAMRLGARWGYRGMVREILDELAKSLGSKHVTVCATGGFAGRVLRGMSPAMHIDNDLTLFGVGRIFDLNTET